MNLHDYPEGADNKYAPWNQVENPEKEFEVTISTTVNKKTTVTTNDYGLEFEGSEPLFDTSSTDWVAAYYGEHCSIDQLIVQFRNFLEKRLEELNFYKENVPLTRSQEREIKNIIYLIKECQEWCVSDEEVIYEN